MGLRLDPHTKFTPEDVRLIEQRDGTLAALEWLSMIPTDRFDGDWEKMYHELEHEIYWGLNKMTIRELAQNWIENADVSPVPKITVETAEQYISWMDTGTELPDGLTPELFAEAWNDIIKESGIDDAV